MMLQTQSILPLLYLSVLTPVVCGCLSEGTPPQSSPVASAAQPELPVVQLPAVDFGKKLTSAREGGESVPLDVVIPQSQFVVQFAGHFPEGKKPGPAIVYIYQQDRRGTMAITAHFFVYPAAKEGRVVKYEGQCIQPPRVGEAILEVQRLKEIHLVAKVKSQ